MNNKRIFEKIITEKRAKSSNERPKYGLRKLTVGVVSCLLGYMMFFTPNVVAAENENVDQPQVVEAVESPKVANAENVKKDSEQPKEEVVETTEAAESKEAEQPVSNVQGDSSKATKTNTQDTTVRTTAKKTSEATTEEKATEGKSQAESFTLELQPIKVVKGQSVENYRKAFKNLPEDATIKVETPADTTTDGEKIATIEITFADKSKKQEIITVRVYETQEELENSELENSEFEELEFSELGDKEPVAAGNEVSKEFTEDKAKENWDQELKDKGYWKLAEGQRLRRVQGNDYVSIYDINYEGSFVDAEGNTNLRFLYNELNGTAGTSIWHRIIVNFGDLTDKIDFEKSYVVGEDGKKTEKFYDLMGQRGLDITKLYSGPRALKRVNFPMNIVLKDGKTLKQIPQENYIVQLRLVNQARTVGGVAEGTEIYTYAPKGTSVDYSSYTKVTSVDLSDNISSTVLEGPKQEKGERIAIQRSFMSEFIANPEEYDDSTQIGILRTEYLGKRGGAIGENIKDVDGKPIGFAQVFDAKLVNYLKEDANGNVAYTNVLTNKRIQGSWVKKIGIKKGDITIKDGLAYVVIARNDSVNAFKKNEIKAVGVPTLDQYINQSGIYFSAIDYLIDKTQLNEEFSPGKRKTDFSMAAGWVEPNTKGWTIFEKTFDEDFVVPKGEKYTINTTNVPEGGQVIIQVGDKNQAILRNKQGYYNSTVASWKQGVDSVDETSPGTYEFTLREGATIKKGEGIRVLLPDTPDHTSPVSFVNQHNADGGTELKVESNSGNIKVTPNNSAGGKIVLKYTLKDQDEQHEIVYTKKGLSWKKEDPDNILEGAGKAWITKSKLEPGTKILVFL